MDPFRLEALRLATSAGGRPHEIVERAAAYYNFLRGDVLTLESVAPKIRAILDGKAA